jgi:hypothetical protein
MNGQDILISYASATSSGPALHCAALHLTVQTVLLQKERHCLHP